MAVVRRRLTYQMVLVMPLNWVFWSSKEYDFRVVGGNLYKSVSLSLSGKIVPKELVYFDFQDFPQNTWKF